MTEPSAQARQWLEWASLAAAPVGVKPILKAWMELS